MMPADNSRPFWKDEPDPHQLTFKGSKVADWLVKALGIFMVLSIFGITFGLVLQLSHLGAVIVVIYFVVVFGGGLLSNYTNKKKLQLAREEVHEIQRAALEKCGAYLMGSAIHVAGHPKLTRDQLVILALTDSSLDFYSPDSGISIDRIPIEQITGVHTVLYDDNRVPHLDTLDITAQALQITASLGCITCDMLLRSMRTVRPIDWYQAIQKARVRVGQANANQG